MLTKIQKWGNSLALRIPKAFALDAHLENESLVEVTVESGKISVTPVRGVRWTLDELLDGITDDNLHAELNFSQAVGNEIC